MRGGGGPEKDAEEDEKSELGKINEARGGGGKAKFGFRPPPRNTLEEEGRDEGA